MILRVLAFAALAALGTAAAAEPPAPASYDAKAQPLDDLSRDLLKDNGYELRDDGRVWDKINDAAVSQKDMPFLLSRLASARRLRALLQINAIITRYDAERKLTSEDKDAVRDLVRKNWVVFGSGPRHDFRSYFGPEELEALDKIPSRFDTMAAVTLDEPQPESVTALPPAAVAAAAAPAAAAPAAAAPAAAVAATPKTIPTLTPMMELPALKRESPFAAPAAIPPAAVPAAPPPAPPAPAAVPAVAVAAPAAAAGVKLATPDLGVLKPWTPPPASTSTARAPAAAPAVSVSTPPAPAVAASSAPAPVPAPAAAAPEPPKPLVVDAAAYEKFVAEGPYAREDKELLQLIGKRAPEFCLPLLRRTVAGAVPQIVVDGARTGRDLRAGFFRDPAKPLLPPVVALSPGPVMVEMKSGFFGGKQALLLPESPDAWSELGLPRPALDAFKPGASPASVENGDWGAVRVFADGSRRGVYSPSEQAGELLEQLLRLGLAREGLDASEYAARRWARTARLMFEARLKDEAKEDAFLDPDRRAELRGWLDRPEEADDLAFAAWSGSRSGAVDPRRATPEAARAALASARESCVRSALADALAEASRRRVRRAGALEALAGAGVVDGSAARGATRSSVEEEQAARTRLLTAPPACPAADPARDEGLRKAALLAAEAARAERGFREAKAGDTHAP